MPTLIAYLKHFLTYDPSTQFAQLFLCIHTCAFVHLFLAGMNVVVCVCICVVLAFHTPQSPHTTPNTTAHTHTHTPTGIPEAAWPSPTHTHTSGPTRVTQRAHEGKPSRFMTAGQRRGAELRIESKNKRRSSMGNFLKTALKIRGLESKCVAFV